MMGSGEFVAFGVWLLVALLGGALLAAAWHWLDARYPATPREDDRPAPPPGNGEA
jgi:hypothetical protein